MRQAVMTSPGTIEHREVDAPAAGPGEVLLRIRRIGVCGSDVHVNHGTHPFTGYPVIQGHEFSASVEAVGAGVENIAVGTKATAMPQETCGVCAPCRRGDAQAPLNTSCLPARRSSVRVLQCRVCPGCRFLR